jgi:hypothetical protein
MDKKPGAGLKSLILITFLLLTELLIISGSNSTFAEDEDNATEVVENSPDLDVIVIDNQVYEKDRKGPSKFEHRKHAKDFGITCWDCHHEYENGENVWSPWGETLKCAECHDPDEKIDDVLKLQAAYHKNCKKCHEEKKIYGNDRLAYRKCNKCHE